MSAFPPGLAAARARLASIVPGRYARSRNFLDGAVTRLSPYVRHGVIDLAEVRDAVLAAVTRTGDAWKLVQELAWRDYWRRVYGAIGERVHDNIDGYKTGHPSNAYAAELPQDVHDGTTGLVCMDAFVRHLVDEGYVHNHARMWFASYLVHHRRVAWQAGARFFLAHLLDGDPASNSLSWQWVASTFARKPYIFNRENLERYTAGTYCRRCPLASGGCPFDASYAELDARLFVRGSRDDEAPDAPALRGEPDPAEPALPAGNVVLWMHPDALQTPHAAAGAPAILTGVAAMAQRDAWSAQRHTFVDATATELGPAAREDAGDASEDGAAASIVAFARQHSASVIMLATPDPLMRSIAARVAAAVPLTTVSPPRFSTLARAGSLRSFSAYWKRAETSAFATATEDDETSTRLRPALFAP